MSPTDPTFVQAYEAVWAGEPVALDVDVIEVHGPDAFDYLQGQLSQDVSAMVVSDAVVPSLLLEPSGKLGFLVGLGRVGEDRFLVVVDRPRGPDVAARLERFKLRTDAEVGLPEGDWHVAAALDPSGAPDGGPAFEVTSTLDGAPGIDPARLAAYDVARIELGLPNARYEARDDVIPAELGQRLVDAAVSFTKGCYTGQELVARVDSRGGNVPRHLRGVVVQGEVVPAPGDELVDGDKVVGELTTAGWSPRLGGPAALAFVHRSIDVPATVSLRGTIDARAEVRALPLVGRSG